MDSITIRRSIFCILQNAQNYLNHCSNISKAVMQTWKTVMKTGKKNMIIATSKGGKQRFSIYLFIYLLPFWLKNY